MSSSISFEVKKSEAISTGKNVEIYSIFLSNDSIPRKYRNEDSDMGHLIEYFDKNGERKETFSHSY